MEAKPLAFPLRHTDNLRINPPATMVGYSFAAGASSPLLLSPAVETLRLLSKQSPIAFPSKPIRPESRPPTSLFVSSPTNNPSSTTLNPAVSKSPAEELVIFDGGAHYGDLVANLVLGFTLLWLPLTLAAVSRAFFLRYRFTNLRVTVISGLTGQDRSDFLYKAIRDVQVVPRFIGEWGDIVITLKDGTKVDLRSVPKFREIADYCLLMAGGSEGSDERKDAGPRGF